MSNDRTDELTPRQVLANARRLLMRPENWHQGGLARGLEVGHYYYPDAFASLPEGAGVCTLGAVEFSLPSERRGWIAHHDDEVRLAAMKYICRAIPLETTIVAIPYWNDAPERTHEQVVAAFDRALLEAAKDERGPSEGPSTLDTPDAPHPDRSLVTA